MELSKQVCSLELAQKLKELGVKQESYFYWFPQKNERMIELFKQTHYIDILEEWENLEECKGTSAFTVAELGELLGNEHKLIHQNGGKIYCYKLAYNFNADTEADARTKCLIYLLENGLIKT